MLDLAPWLNPINGENPSGENLRDDPRFHALERLMEPHVDVVRDERNKPLSQSVVPVDWGEVLAQAEELRSHGRDLRLLVIVARALFNDRGPEGLADGLTLIGKTVELHWETLHPELRPAPNPRDAALRRINALLQLQNPEDGLLGDLRRGRAFMARGLGPVSGRDLELGTLDSRTALNEAKLGMSDKERAAFAQEHDALVVRVRSACAALADQAPGELAMLTGAMRSAGEALEALEAALADRVGTSLLLPDVKRALARMLATLERAAPAAAAGPEPAPDSVLLVPMETPMPLVEANRPAALPTRLTTRQEVIVCLDRIIEFYDRTEPASPVPFLARRMRRMVPMDFLELMEDLAPSGLKEFRSLAGLGDDKKATRNPG